MQKITLPVALSALLVLAGCGNAPTTASRPDQFSIVSEGRYEVTRQSLMVDCVFDGFLSVQEQAMATHVRQVKRADGWRIDVIAGAFQYLVVDMRDDGTFKLIRNKAAVLVPLSKDEAAATACLNKFPAK